MPQRTAFLPLTGMAILQPLMMKSDMPVSLVELLAIPLSNPNTIAKWLVISPSLSRRARETMIRYASFTLDTLPC